MITFKQFINEAILKPWSEEAVEFDSDIITKVISNEAAMKAIATGGLLFRGFYHASRGQAIYIDPRNSKRSSRDSHNLYQLAMDRSEKLEDFPPRSSSLIGTSSWAIANDYGNLYVMLPDDGAKVAVSNSPDFLHLELDSELGSSIQLFDSTLRRICTILGVKPSVAFKFHDADEINNALDSVSARRAAEIVFDAKECDLIYYENFFAKHTKNRFDALATDEMTPSKLQLELVPFGQSIPAARECWVGSRCLLVPASVFAKIIRKLEDAGKTIHPSYIRDATKWIYKD